jgi:hypothetical protein
MILFLRNSCPGIQFGLQLESDHLQKKKNITRWPHEFQHYDNDHNETQHNGLGCDIQHNDNQHNEKHHNDLYCDIKHYDNQHNDNQHNDNQHNGLDFDTQHNDIQHSDTQYNGFIATLSIMTLDKTTLGIKVE